MPSDITVVVTTVGQPRDGMLRRAAASVAAQTLLPDAILIAEDWEHAGAAVNRQAGTDLVRTGLVAYLDDDDEMYPQHLEHLRDLLVAEDADLVFPWFDVEGGTDPFPECFGRNWQAYVDEHGPYQVPVTFLAKTEAIQAAGGWTYGWDATADPGTDAYGNRAGEDFRLICRMVDRHARIVHLPERTWRWHHHGGNSSGLPERVPW